MQIKRPTQAQLDLLWEMAHGKLLSDSYAGMTALYTLNDAGFRRHIQTVNARTVFALRKAKLIDCEWTGFGTSQGRDYYLTDEGKKIAGILDQGRTQ